MNKLLLCLCALVLLAALPRNARAEFQGNADAAMQEQLRRMLSSRYLTFSDGCFVPGFQPQVVNLSRNYQPNTPYLIDTFFGGGDLVFDEDPVVNALWGKGTRYKSGTVIYVGTAGGVDVRQDIGQSAERVEVVPAWLDTYTRGFVYANNISHRPVYATDVKLVTDLKADVTYKSVYNEEAGKQAARQVLEEMFGPLTVPDGFRIKEQTAIQRAGERLFIYRATPEYLTQYQESAEDKTQKPIAVPVLDGYLHVQLDGDKLICGLEYFWDPGLQVLGTPQPSVQAAVAVNNARDWLVDSFGGDPPIVTVDAITMGFVQDRIDPSRLIPAWLFDAWFVQNLTATNRPEHAYNETSVRVPKPFAVNALTGQCFWL